MADEKRRDVTSELGRKRGPNAQSSAMALFGVGFELVVLVVLGFYAGQWLDRRFGTAPLFLIVGVFAGMGAGFYSMFSTLKASQRRRERGGGK